MRTGVALPAGVVQMAWTALLLPLPVWAALVSTHRPAELPVMEAAVDWAAAEWMLAAIETQLAAEAARATSPAAVSSVEEARPRAAFPPSVERWRQLVEGEIAALHGTRGLHAAVTPDLVLAVIAAESGGDPAAQSPARAVGLMQLLPTTLTSLLSGAGASKVDGFDPQINVRAGILYLDEAVKRHEGGLEWALAGYNAGIPASLRARTTGTPLWRESTEFVSRVMAALQPYG